MGILGHPICSLLETSDVYVQPFSRGEIKKKETSIGKG